MAELRPYEPTWRDRLASALLGDGRSAGRQQFVDGLLGSRGLGQTGMGLVDLTPAGVPLAVQESRQAFEQGSPVSGLLGAMAVLPAAKPAALAAKTAAGEAAQGIRAYHGSPYDFERFDLGKVNTGLGEQAYSHGLYFAGSEPVGQGYKRNLAPGMVDESGRSIKMPEDKNALAAYELLRSSDDDYGKARSLISQHRQNAKGSYREELDAMSDWLDVWQGSKAKPAGRMYEVNIRANPEQFLDWDKPLREQTEAVRRALTPEGLGLKPVGPFGDKGFYGWVDASGQRVGPMRTGAPPKELFSENDTVATILRQIGGGDMALASERLRAAGVPGVSYLDRGARSAGEGSRNYVVYDDSLIDILRKYGLVGLLGGGAAAGAVSQQPEGM